MAWLHRLKDCRGSWDARDFASTRCIRWTAGKQHLRHPGFDACDSCFMLFLHLRSSTWSLKREVAKTCKNRSDPCEVTIPVAEGHVEENDPQTTSWTTEATRNRLWIGHLVWHSTWWNMLWILGKRWIPGLETLLRAWLGEQLWKDEEEKLLLGRQGKTNRWGLNLWINICEMSDSYGNVVAIVV